tara:strand:+ start:402 stop:932 length:531 start_codon:yes stop_codon:yes gene_type:complete
MNKNQLKKWREDYTVWDAPCLGEGLYLHVHFDEKDDVKRLGGRWNPDPSGKGGHWWMPFNNLSTTCPIECEPMGDGWSGTIEDWLNNMKMIGGQYGKLNVTDCLEQVDEGWECNEYQLMAPCGEISTMMVYADLDMVSITNQHGDVSWTNMRDARVVWEMLIKSNHRKVIRQEEIV